MLEIKIKLVLATLLVNLKDSSLKVQVSSFHNVRLLLMKLDLKTSNLQWRCVHVVLRRYRGESVYEFADWTCV